MKAFNKLFSMLAAIVVSAVLPFSMAAESEASQHQNSYSGSNVTTSVTSESKQDDESA
ncbi:MAG: hypothetical protein HRU39_12655 [Salinicola sp.]|uniref:hypothetical protein n=1 Tax=Salinicola sp. TaxID=1978524 RepID=UPI001DB5A710|nr:hypothetical protein [Salinicola sp.]NRB56809.1 hypothetical protein [Salinicola sp.]|tara:strand:- start:1519 stop:1692 length:174 start_codon:yes stop_codon:yes gene_type:complete